MHEVQFMTEGQIMRQHRNSFSRHRHDCLDMTGAREEVEGGYFFYRIILFGEEL